MPYGFSVRTLVKTMDCNDPIHAVKPQVNIRRTQPFIRPPAPCRLVVIGFYPGTIIPLHRKTPVACKKNHITDPERQIRPVIIIKASDFLHQQNPTFLHKHIVQNFFTDKYNYKNTAGEEISLS